MLKYPRSPDLDGPVSAGGHDVFIVEIYHVHSRSMADEDASQVDLSGADHVPDRDTPVLATRHHHPQLVI